MANLRMPDIGKIVQLAGLDQLSQSGIYFLLHEEVVVYVGQARNMRRRVGGHLAEGLKTFDSVAFVPCSPQRLNVLERRYIEKLIPKYNHTFTKVLRQAGVEGAAGGKLVATERRVRIPRTNARRTIKVLA